ADPTIFNECASRLQTALNEPMALSNCSSRDLWRQKYLEETRGSLKLTISGHGVKLLELTRVE
ncbi:MAG: hypothetical protein ACP5XB_16485, partial [Isosphaeraceae bacterium]